MTRRTNNPLPNAVFTSKILISAAAAMALAACGGGSGGGTTTFSGAVVKGPVNGAQVCAFALAGNAQGAALGSCVTTDANGNYTLSLPAGSGPLWLQASGGTYVDEITSVLTTLPAGNPLSTLITTNGGAVSAMLTPLTTLALNAAVANVGGSGTLNAAAFSAAATQLLTTFSLPAGLDINGTLPAFGTGINSYGTALTAISQMVANGTPLATLLANSNPATLATAFAAAQPAAGTGVSGGSGSSGSPSATGTLTVSGLADFTPQATGFEVSVASSASRASYRFFVETQRAIGAGFTTDKREVNIEPTSGTGYSVTLYNSATGELNTCYSNCTVTVNPSNGATHPVQVSFAGLALSGTRTLNGTLTGDAPGAAWTVADLPGGSTSNLTVGGTSVSVLGSTDSVIDLGGGTSMRTISLRLSDTSILSLQKTGNAPFSVTRVVPPATLSTCTNACNTTVVDGSGTQLTFANTPLSGGLVLNGTVDFARTSGSLTSNDAVGGFTPVTSNVESLNSTRTLTFSVLGTPAQSGISLVTVEVAAGSVVRVQATVGIASQLLGCLANGAGIGLPPCTGVTVGTDGRTVAFNNAVLRGGAIGATARDVTFNGTLVVKGP
jgi:hypothetical protein